MVVSEEKIGNTVIRFHDDCIVKTQEEREAILGDIARLVTMYYQKEKMLNSVDSRSSSYS